MAAGAGAGAGRQAPRQCCNAAASGSTFIQWALQDKRNANWHTHTPHRHGGRRPPHKRSEPTPAKSSNPSPFAPCPSRTSSRHLSTPPRRRPSSAERHGGARRPSALPSRSRLHAAWGSPRPVAMAGAASSGCWARGARGRPRRLGFRQSRATVGVVVGRESQRRWRPPWCSP